MRAWLLASACLAAASALLASPPASAAFLHGEALDRMADIVTLVVLFIVPLGLIALFWIVHVMPEKIAERRHHPQKDAIKTLCLLSLLFGGLLWPIAWIWAYTRPVLHKMAYGTDKHEDYYRELAEREGRHAGMLAEDVAVMRRELGALAQRGARPAELAAMQERLAVLESRLIAVSEEPKS